MSFLTAPTTVDLLEAERDRRAREGSIRRLRGARLVTNPRFRDIPRVNQILVGAMEPPVEWPEIREQAEPTLRALGVRTRRVMLFGEETRQRLAGALTADGYRESLMWLLAHRGITTAHANPDVAIRLVDPFLRPAWFTLSYRLEQEDGNRPSTAADRVAQYAQRADEPGRRTYAGFLGDNFAGSVDLARLGSLASIQHVQTDPEWRGRGVATTLTLRAIEDAIRSGARGVHLVTHRETLADQLYRPCGFERASILSIFERRPYD